MSNFWGAVHRQPKRTMTNNQSPFVKYLTFDITSTPFTIL